ncbi:MAG: hypothetical protein HC906_18740 [Bacteroidales bacterium]|nr:hypothetical protein [Bacteroidales bacterium]
MITVKPISGFANRIRVIDSALALAKSLNEDLTIVWERSYELNCRFDKIFKTDGEFKVVEHYAPPLRNEFQNDFRSL